MSYCAEAPRRKHDMIRLEMNKRQRESAKWPGWHGGFMHWYVWDSNPFAMPGLFDQFDRNMQEIRHATMLEF